MADQKDSKQDPGGEEQQICYGCMTMQIGNVCPSCGYDRNQEVSPMYLRPGTVLAKKYLIGKVIGHGGFGITYLAYDTVLGIRLAVKEYLVQEYASREPSGRVIAHSGEAKDRFEEGISRFLEEARSLARFEGNPGIVSARDFFRANGTAYMVMVYLEGANLRQYLAEKGPMSYDHVRQEIIPVLTGALTVVHSAGMLHRDISPDNIFLTKHGQIRLLDFGAARHVMSDAKSMSIILKPGYAPEEQYRSHGKQGPWTDVYAVAATVYRTITGKVPPESLDRLANDTLIPPSNFCDIPPGHERVLLKAMSVKAEDRYQTMLDFYNAILAEQEKSGENGESVTMAYRGTNSFQNTARNAPQGRKPQGFAPQPKRQQPQRPAPDQRQQPKNSAQSSSKKRVSAVSTTYSVIKILIGIAVILAVVAIAFVLIRLILNQLTGSIPDIFSNTATSQSSPTPDVSALVSPGVGSPDPVGATDPPNETEEPQETPEPVPFPNVSEITVNSAFAYGDAVMNALAYVPSANRDITYGVAQPVGNLIYFTAKPSQGNAIVSRFITDGASLEHGKVEHFFARDGSLYSYTEGNSGAVALIIPAGARAGMSWRDAEGYKEIAEVAYPVTVRGTTYQNCLVILRDVRYVIYSVGVGEIAVVDDYTVDVQNPHLRLRYNDTAGVNMTPALEGISTEYSLIE